jgi:endonuclease/exonuclease/phosphatase family metal-dependent hydrolase
MRKSPDITGGSPPGARKGTPLILVVLLLIGSAATGFAGAIDAVNSGSALIKESADSEARYFRGPLKVMTLNMAHGRKTAFSQIFLSWQSIHQNLLDISAVLNTTAPDIVALQEADGPSWWSGNFDHVALLAQEAGFPWYSRAGYVAFWSLDYGAALLARRPYLETRAHRFERSLPSPPKGFLLGRFGWFPERQSSREPIYVDVVSVHLDFSREKIRARQIDELRGVLTGRKNPLVLMGDFNSRWFTNDSVVQTMSRRAGLQVYRPEAADLGTYGSGRYRFDWVLISAELEFISYQVLPQEISDHRAVVAVIGFKGPVVK